MDTGAEGKFLPATLESVTETRRSVCALDCPDCCSLLINVDEQGNGSKLRGDPHHPFTRGFLCAKVAHYLEREYHPDRLLYPQRRIGAKGEGRFARITWNEALDTIAERLSTTTREWGSEAILPYSYAGTMGYLNGSGMDRRFFHRLGASRLDRTICASAGAAGITAALGARLGTDPENFRHARLILVWGANIHGTNVHLWPFLQEARRAGARIYTIDPVVTRTASLADRHYPIYPGTDLALALGLLHVIFREGLEDREYIDRHTSNQQSLREASSAYPPEHAEQLTGIPASSIIELAHEYANTRPAVIRLNYGVQRSERGGRAVHAISLLPAVTGAWRHVGGGLLLTTSGAFTVNRDALERPDLQNVALGREARVLNMSLLGRALNEVVDPPVKAMVVYNSNPAAIAPNQTLVRKGLLREDLFTVVLEQFQTDTADHADVLLPATTFLEHTDLYFAYGHYYLQLARPALPAPGECKSNVEVFRLIAQRMGFSEPCFQETEDDMIRAALASGHPYLEGIALEQLEREHFVRLRLGNGTGPFQPFAEGGFATPDGRCDLSAEHLDYVPPVESRKGDTELRASFPLELVSSKNSDSMNSTFGNREDVNADTLCLHLHPEDAAPRGISTGDRVLVWNGRGRIRLQAIVDGSVRSGVVRAPSVPWARKHPDRTPLNVLTSDRLTDIGGGPVFYNCLVEVQRCEN